MRSNGIETHGGERNPENCVYRKLWVCLTNALGNVRQGFIVIGSGGGRSDRAEVDRTERIVRQRCTVGWCGAWDFNAAGGGICI